MNYNYSTQIKSQKFLHIRLIFYLPKYFQMDYMENSYYLMYPIYL